MNSIPAPDKEKIVAPPAAPSTDDLKHEYTDDELIEITARRILDKYRDAFKELAK